MGTMEDTLMARADLLDAGTSALVIDRLGGTVVVARLCRTRSQAVSQWRRIGIPGARLDYLRLLRPDVFVDLPR